VKKEVTESIETDSLERVIPQEDSYTESTEE
jgi:hypothetical protein